MDAKILIVVLLAFSLIFFGCAKSGTPQDPFGGLQSSWPHLVQVNGTEGNTTGAEASGGVQAGGGNQTQNQTQGGAAGGNASGQDLGDLFNIDTAQPDSGSGYNVPAAGE